MNRLALTLLLLCSSASLAAETITGPIRADVIRAIDGDTIEVRAHVWIGLSMTSGIRLRGIDTPEMYGGCPESKALATTARDVMIEIAGTEVMLTNIENGKFAGRVVADVSANGIDLGSEMVERGLARRYDGGARASWCTP